MEIYNIMETNIPEDLLKKLKKKIEKTGFLTEMNRLNFILTI